ncbi:hypothetical protein BS78_02G145700 [Paspalum vaginatum]|nr:hypothetical protein BS78_02G145700 [Paspalum vaginatum]
MVNELPVPSSTAPFPARVRVCLEFLLLHCTSIQLEELEQAANSYNIQLSCLHTSIMLRHGSTSTYDCTYP